MHYRVGDRTVRSENAAKVPQEASKALSKWIRENVDVKKALDYGCGRLRYTPHLAAASDALSIVDSSEQLDRTTRIGRRRTTIRSEALGRWPTVRVYSVREFLLGIRDRFDFVLCANVLSAIPSNRIRSLSLAAIHGSLARRGTLLVVNQHTNSYFSAMRRDRRSIEHLDGWIVDSPKGTAYFGVMRKPRVVRLLQRHGFAVTDSWIVGQSNYVLARPQ